MDGEPLEAIRRAFNARRGRLPPADEVRVRANRRRALSLTRPHGRVRLNLARAVVEAGPEAWALIAPTLRREPEARARFRELVTPRMPDARRPARPTGLRADGGATAGSAVDAPSGRPVRPTRPARCQGTARERWVLQTIWAWARERFQDDVPLPSPVRLRVSRRMRRSYGNAAWKGDRYELTLGAQLFREGLEPALLDTFLHELAHLVDMAQRGRTDHGRSWRAWARRLGAEPSRLLAGHQVERVAAAAAAPPCELPEPVRSWWKGSRPARPSE